MVYLAGETCRRVFGIRPSMKSSSGYCEADSSEVAVRSRLVRLASDLSGVMSVLSGQQRGEKRESRAMIGVVKGSMTGLETVRYEDSSAFGWNLVPKGLGEVLQIDL